MGTASVALADFWSLQNNQAGLAYFNTPAAGAYFENRFLVKEFKNLNCFVDLNLINDFNQKKPKNRKGLK
jgi:hypothetical protein